MKGEVMIGVGMGMMGIGMRVMIVVKKGGKGLMG